MKATRTPNHFAAALVGVLDGNVIAQESWPLPDIENMK